MEMNYIELEETSSTNTYLQGIASEVPHATVVSARRQTAGRGQRGNTWESAPGQNVTMSLLLRPAVAPARQFLLSEAVALAVVHTLDGYLEEPASVKWPNDIYVGDRKICGLLIEHSLSGGRINYTIAGIGLNVNQREFLSDAPNPVSVWQLTGREFPVGDVVRQIAEEAVRLCDALPDRMEATHSEFLSRLYRREGFYQYRAIIGSSPVVGATELPVGTRFEARIVGVAGDGILTLGLRDGSLHRFAFKEVEFLL